MSRIIAIIGLLASLALLVSALSLLDRSPQNTVEIPDNLDLAGIGERIVATGTASHVCAIRDGNRIYLSDRELTQAEINHLTLSQDCMPSWNGVVMVSERGNLAVDQIADDLPYNHALSRHFVLVGDRVLLSQVCEALRR